MDIFRRRNSRKGQAAIEFLMTYGWMLLIVLIVGALIFSFVDFGSLLPNAVDLNNNFRAEPTQSQATASAPSAATGAVLVTFIYNGNDRLTINAEDDDYVTNPGVNVGTADVSRIENVVPGADCDLNWIKNVDTDTATALNSAAYSTLTAGSTSATVNFLRGQTGLAEFICQGLVEDDVIEGKIILQFSSAQTGVPIKSEGNLRIVISS